MFTNNNVQYGSLTVMYHIFYILLQPQTHQISPTTGKNTDEGPFSSCLWSTAALFPTVPQVLT